MKDDEHIAELQRLAYGASASDPVRARAGAELAQLAAAAGGVRGSPRGDAHDAIAHDAGSHQRGSHAAGASRGDAFDERRPDPTADPVARVLARSRARRRAALVGVAGVLVGAAAVSVISRGAPTEPVLASAGVAPTAPAFGSGERAIPVVGSELMAGLDLLPPVADLSPLGEALDGIDPTSVRLLATRADGLSAYIGRTSDGADVCLILLPAPAGGAQGECTTGGMVPAGGLHVRHVSPKHGSAVAVLYASGAITLGRVSGR